MKYFILAVLMFSFAASAKTFDGKLSVLHSNYQEILLPAQQITRVLLLVSHPSGLVGKNGIARVSIEVGQLEQTNYGSCEIQTTPEEANLIMSNIAAGASILCVVESSNFQRRTAKAERYHLELEGSEFR